MKRDVGQRRASWADEKRLGKGRRNILREDVSQGTNLSIFGTSQSFCHTTYSTPRESHSRRFRRGREERIETAGLSEVCPTSRMSDLSWR